MSFHMTTHRQLPLADIERNQAIQAAEFTRTLAALEPDWGSRVFDLAGGYAVLAGPGLFVNRAVGVGISCEMSEADFDALEQNAADVGVCAALEIVPFALPGAERIARARGYVATDSRTVVSRTLANVTDATSLGFRVTETGPAEVAEWQELAALAFGATSGVARRASDTYAATSMAVPTDHLFVAWDGGRPVACASLTLRDRVATLGGMGTVPAERGRGAQRAMIAARLAFARAAGCEWAVSSAVSEGSIRNLVRAGFELRYKQTTWTRDVAEAPTVATGASAAQRA